MTQGPSGNSPPVSPGGSTVRELVGAEVLVVDKDRRVQTGMTQLLSAASLHVTCVDSPQQAFDSLAKRFFSVVVIDLDTPQPNAGLSTAAEVKAISPTSMIVMLTPRKSYDDAVASIRAGAVDVILKSPESVGYLKDRVMAAADRSVGKREVHAVLGEVRAVHEDFLKRFMDSERRALDLEDRIAGRDHEAVFGEEVRVLVVASDEGLAQALAASKPRGFAFETALTGGEALDRCGSSQFHIAMVARDLPDLPGSMVVRNIKAQYPQLMTIEYSPPGSGGRVDVVEATRRIPVLDRFDRVDQLAGRLDELAEAFRVKAREQRYSQAIRERHYEFLRRYVDLKRKIDHASSGD